MKFSNLSLALFLEEKMSYMGAKLWYRSCPAVSQISNFTVVSLRQTVCVKKAAKDYRKKTKRGEVRA
jgi:hypothetical protein